MELNIEKINNELNRIGKTKYWLAKKIGTSTQLVLYWFSSKSLRGAEPIAKVFGIEPKDLIK
jgi:hypothetical protein